MSKRGASERDAYTPSQGNLRKARVEVRRVDAIQILMAAARSRSTQPQAQQQQQQQEPPAAGAAAAALPPTAPGGATATAAQPAAPNGPHLTAPCTHCGTVLPVSSDACSLRQCCGCYDVFCSLCSVLDYEEREDRVFCLSCLEDQTSTSRQSRGSGAGGRGSGAGVGGGRGNTVGASLSLGLSLPMTGPAGRWGQMDQLGAACSPFPCSRTPQQQQQQGSRTPGSAIYSSRSHRSFSALLAYGGVGS